MLSYLLQRVKEAVSVARHGSNYHTNFHLKVNSLLLHMDIFCNTMHGSSAYIYICTAVIFCNYNYIYYV
jgi:hypothetical protein